MFECIYQIEGDLPYFDKTCCSFLTNQIAPRIPQSKSYHEKGLTVLFCYKAHKEVTNALKLTLRAL